MADLRGARRAARCNRGTTADVKPPDLRWSSSNGMVSSGTAGTGSSAVVAPMDSVRGYVPIVNILSIAFSSGLVSASGMPGHRATLSP